MQNAASVLLGSKLPFAMPCTKARNADKTSIQCRLLNTLVSIFRQYKRNSTEFKCMIQW